MAKNLWYAGGGEWRELLPKDFIGDLVTPEVGDRCEMPHDVRGYGGSNDAPWTSRQAADSRERFLPSGLKFSRGVGLDNDVYYVVPEWYPCDTCRLDEECRKCSREKWPENAAA